MMLSIPIRHILLGYNVPYFNQILVEHVKMCKKLFYSSSCHLTAMRNAKAVRYCNLKSML